MSLNFQMIFIGEKKTVYLLIDIKILKNRQRLFFSTKKFVFFLSRLGSMRNTSKKRLLMNQKRVIDMGISWISHLFGYRLSITRMKSSDFMDK